MSTKCKSFGLNSGSDSGMSFSFNARSSGFVTKFSLKQIGHVIWLCLMSSRRHFWQTVCPQLVRSLGIVTVELKCSEQRWQLTSIVKAVKWDVNLVFNLAVGSTTDYKILKPETLESAHRIKEPKRLPADYRIQTHARVFNLSSWDQNPTGIVAMRIIG